jgi:amino acid adenylation domain-containing protein
MWPQNVALVDGSRKTTFAELHQRVLAVASQLRRLGVRPRERVAILGGCGTETIVALLAISTVGAVYVAIDPNLPLSRIEWLLKDAEVCGVIGTRDLRSRLPTAAIGQFYVSLDELAVESAGELLESSDVGQEAIDASEVAYILYTSGSTGLPKGVQIEHRNVFAFFVAHNERVNIHSGDRCLNTGHLHFDVSVMDVLLPLYLGATVYFPPKTPIPTLILRMLDVCKITHFYAVGSLLGVITGDGSRLAEFDLSQLRVLQTGAEVCNVRVVNEWLSRYPMLQFLNSYGPTEATVGCVSYLKPSTGPLIESDCPIGKPHSGTCVKVIDLHGAVVCGRRIVGEMIVGGPQVMRGYWRRPIDDRKSITLLDGVRYYRTGDFVFLDEDDNYRFVGRRDDEIKLNGFRIHLNEVRRCLNADTNIEAAEVGVVEAGKREIVAALVLAAGRPPTHVVDSIVRASALLPEYMVPTRWAVAPAMPRTSSGKSDRLTVLSTLERAIQQYDAALYLLGENGFEPLEQSCKQS